MCTLSVLNVSLRSKYFEGVKESYHFDDDEAEMLPNHLLGTTPLIESLRPKSYALFQHVHDFLITYGQFA